MAVHRLQNPPHRRRHAAPSTVLPAPDQVRVPFASAAIEVALRVLRPPPESRVLVPAVMFCGVAQAVLHDRPAGRYRARTTALGRLLPCFPALAATDPGVPADPYPDGF